MNVSRRSLGFLLPFLHQYNSRAQSGALHSATFNLETLPARRNGTYASRQILKGATHIGLVDLHESELEPGQMPHAAHRHRHEEILLILAGQIELTVNGETTQLHEGSVAYMASGDLHGWKNSGTTTARYFVLALGDDNG